MIDHIPRIYPQAIDDDSNQTGQMLAALLDWPQVDYYYGNVCLM